MILSRGAALPFQIRSINTNNADPLSWSASAVATLGLSDPIIPAGVAMMVGLPLLGLAAGLTCKRLAIQGENLPVFRTIILKYGWLQSLISSLCTCLTADLLVEICLLLGSGGSSWLRSSSLPPPSTVLLSRSMLGNASLSHGLISASITGYCLRLLFLWTGVRLGEQFIPVALTGSIATGKSTVAKMLLLSSSSSSSSATAAGAKSQPRFRIVDTDAIGHQILLPPREIERLLLGRTTTTDSSSNSTCCSPRDSVFARIVAEFGDAAVHNQNILNDDGLIERRKLGDIIFKDSRRRRALNRITHPKITWVLLKQLVAHLYRYHSTTRPVVVIADVPLLYESKSLTWLFALKIVVACRPEIQLARLRQRNADLTEQQCRERIASQIPVTRKVAMADVVIHNNGGPEDLKREIHGTQQRIVALLHGKSILPLSTFVGMIGSLWIIISALSKQ
jgi:dephospho-CoA kinase